MGLIQKAREFLQSKSTKSQAFLDREHELKTKITELEAKKSKLISEYDPTKSFDSKAIDIIDADIAVASKEIAVLNETKKYVPEHDVSESLKHIEQVKSEASDIVAEKIKAEEGARAKIVEAKKAFLEAQAAHYRLIRDAQDFKADTNETLSQLSAGIKQEIGNLRRHMQKLDREIYDLSPDGSSAGILGHQAQLDAVQDERSKIMSQIVKLEQHVSGISLPIGQLDMHRDKNGKTVYFIHQQEQFDATNKGIIQN